MRIALDAMGGDHAPGPIVAGAISAVRTFDDVTVVLVGDRGKINEHLPSECPRERIEVVHSEHSIGMDESPVEGLRRKPDNSISKCWQMLADKNVDAVVSAGNTGAMVAGGLRLRAFLKNVKRPGIATLMPTVKGRSVVLDVGANVNPKPIHLFQYGIMGMVFARDFLKIQDPRIGLMNVGEEQGKGHSLVQQTHNLFRESPYSRNFIGNIEGRDIHRGVCEVVVTDGFVGNVILKLTEGVFDFVMKMVATEIIAPLPSDRGLAQKAFHNLLARYDYSSFGGAPLLGIDGICIICHGSSGEIAIHNAIRVAADYARIGLNQMIIRELETLPNVAEEES